MSIIARFGLILVLCFYVRAETCKYEFIVPEENCKPNPVLEDEAQSIMHIQSNVEMTNERLNSLAESFSNQLTKLHLDSKSIQDVTRALESRLEKAQTNFDKLNSLVDEVKDLKESLNEAKNSLNPRFTDLQAKVIDIAAKFQSQAAAQSNVYSSLQRQLAETTSAIGQHSRDIEKLKETAKTVENIMEKVPTPQLKVPNMKEIEDRLTRIEEAFDKGSPSQGVMDSMKSALNLLQTEFVSSVQEHRQQVMSLNGMITSLQSDMEVLKRKNRV